MLLVDREQRFATLLLSQAPHTASRNAGGIINVTDTTRKWFINAINQFIQYAGDIRIDELSPQLLQDFQTAVSRRASNSTANNYLRAISTIYNRLLKLGFVASNPAAYIPSLPEPPSYPKAISQETYEAMRLAAANKRNQTIIDLLYVSGCRIGELQSIMASQIEIEADRNKLAMMVLGKGGKYRHIYATGLQAQTIIQYIEERPLTRHKQLFLNNKGQPLAYYSYHSVIRTTKQAANLSEHTIANAHAFRHAAALRWLDEGIDLATVSQWLGHQNPEFTARVYCIRTEAQLRQKFYNR